MSDQPKISECRAFAVALDAEHPDWSAAEMIAALLDAGGTLTDFEVGMLGKEIDRLRRQRARGVTR